MKSCVPAFMYSFSRFTGIVNPGLDVDLADGEYFILFGVGETPTCE